MPHVLRHTCALTVLQATKDLRKVSLWLGHAHMQTTEMNTRADPSVKLEARGVSLPEAPHNIGLRIKSALRRLVCSHAIPALCLVGGSGGVFLFDGHPQERIEWDRVSRVR